MTRYREALLRLHRMAATVEADRDRYREALRQADEELLLIADEAPEDIGERIDSVRALLKDVVALEQEGRRPGESEAPSSAAGIAPQERS